MIRKLIMRSLDFNARRMKELENGCISRFAKAQDRIEHDRMVRKRRMVSLHKKDKKIDFFY